MSGKTAPVKEIARKKVKLSVDAKSVDGVLVFVDNENQFRFDVKHDTAELQRTGTETTGLASGLYVSAFGENSFVVTYFDKENEENRSFIYEIKDGKTVKTDVGNFENTFFYNGELSYIKIEDTDYVKKAGFQHRRTDVGATALNKIHNVQQMKSLATQHYSEFDPKLLYREYSDSYNVWEPCYTHRFGEYQYMNALKNYKDENYTLKMLSYTVTGDVANYYELTSKFYVLTYAEGIIESDKIRVYPLRMSLETLYGKFINDPQWLVALEPIHEIEIDCGENTVGDYSPYMIETFRSYLISRYGTVENINKKFGTDFKTRADIQAPSNGNVEGRGAWDLYEGPFFDEWTIFSRQIVNKRLAEAFREALLAGFPAEIINGHSIPEGDAITGFLGEANTRISPVDAMMTLGASFGATRYGLWFENSNNFLKLASKAGFKNTTLGEYNSMTLDEEASYKQLMHLWNNGVKFINLMNSVSWEGYRSDLYQIQKLAEENEPRPGSAKGTSASLAIRAGEKKYQLVELGGTKDDCGLLKSVNEDGSWTGDVYLSPFHSAVNVQDFQISSNVRSGGTSPVFSDLNTGDVIEMNFVASYSGSGAAKVIIDVYEDDVKNDLLSKTFTISGEERPYKYTVYNDVRLGSIKIKVHYECEDKKSLKVSDFNGAVMRESIARKFYDDLSATEHVGGFTFDIIDRRFLYTN